MLDIHFFNTRPFLFGKNRDKKRCNYLYSPGFFAMLGSITLRVIPKSVILTPVNRQIRQLANLLCNLRLKKNILAVFPVANDHINRLIF